MKLIIGLGNPGEKYKDTRHSVGHMLIEQLSKIPQLQGVKIFKSDKFMNDSGAFVLKTLNTYKVQPDSLYVVHDDLDIKLGEYKIQFGKGPKDHNGLKDTYDKLDTKGFWHVRVGVENREVLGIPRGEDYVLQDFTSEEKKVVDRVIEEICKKLEITLKNTS